MSIEVKCKCGKILPATFDVDSDCDGMVEVEACADCIAAAVNYAQQESYKGGYDESDAANSGD